MRLRIAEVFHSIQGEGRWAGTPSTFIRTTGCNLRCWFCDTDYTSWRPEGGLVAVDELVQQARRSGNRHVVITGGEPLLQPAVVPLTERLHADGFVITVETAGTIYRPVHADLMSISPKLGNSTPDDPRWRTRHEATRDRPHVIRQMLAEYDYQLKFVIDTPRDIDDVLAYVRRFPHIERTRVFLMPQARTPRELAEKTPWIRRAAAELGMKVSPRLHIERWGNVRGR